MAQLFEIIISGLYLGDIECFDSHQWHGASSRHLWCIQSNFAHIRVESGCSAGVPPFKHWGTKKWSKLSVRVWYHSSPQNLTLLKCKVTLHGMLAVKSCHYQQWLTSNGAKSHVLPIIQYSRSGSLQFPEGYVFSFVEPKGFLQLKILIRKGNKI